MPVQNGQAAADSDQKCETDSPWIVFFWLYIQDEDNLGGLPAMCNWGVCWEESIPNKD